MWKDGQECEIDNNVYREDRIFRSVDEALGTCAMLYSSIVARRSADQEIEEFGLFRASVSTQKVVKVKALKTSTPRRGVDNSKGLEMSKTARSKVPMDAVITVLTDGNPKKRTAAERFAKYRSGMTVQDYVNAIDNPTLAVNDILWDTDKGWIKYEIVTTDSGTEEEAA